MKGRRISLVLALLVLGIRNPKSGIELKDPAPYKEFRE